MAAEVAEEHASLKHVEGTVSAVNAHGIAVETDKTDTTSQEMYLPFAKGLRLQGVKSLRELQSGDAVSVEYREAMIKDERGEYSKVNRSATTVTRVAPAPKEPATAPAQDPNGQPR